MRSAKTTVVESSRALEEPMFPLIEYPEALDLDDQYDKALIGMVTSHNWMIRAMNSVYSQALDPQTDADKKSFAGYIICLTHYTHHHHAAEEIFLFPEAEKRAPGSMTHNMEQHQAFHEGLDALDAFAKGVQNNPSTYDGERLRGILERLGTPFIQHLHEEIPTLERSKLKAIFTDEDFRRIWGALLNWVIKTNPKLTGLPWVLTHHESADIPSFLASEVPYPVIFLTRYVFSWFYSSYWRWSPCDVYNVRKPNVNVGHVKKPLLRS